MLFKNRRKKAQESKARVAFIPTGIKLSKELQLWDACEKGDSNRVRQLIADGARVTAFNNAPLICAIEKRHHDIIKMLLEAGADATAQENLPIRTAAKVNDLEGIDILIEYNADIHDCKDAVARTASETDNVPILERCLEQNVNIHMEDDILYRLAVKSGSKNCVKALLATGEISKFLLYRLIAIAEQNGDEEMKQILVSYQATVSTPITDFRLIAKKQEPDLQLA